MWCVCMIRKLLHVQVLYYVAGVAVVYTPPADSCDGGEVALGHTQRFFLGHDDDIRSLALCPAPVQVCFPVTGTYFKNFICSGLLHHKAAAGSFLDPISGFIVVLLPIWSLFLSPALAS